MKEQWKKQMQKKMADYKEPAVEVSWAEVEKALEGNRRRVRRTILLRRSLAAAAIVLLVAGVGFLTNFRLGDTSNGELANRPQRVGLTVEKNEKVSVGQMARLMVRQVSSLAHRTAKKYEETAQVAEALFEQMVETNEDASEETSMSEQTDSSAMSIPKYTSQRTHWRAVLLSFQVLCWCRSPRIHPTIIRMEIIIRTVMVMIIMVGRMETSQVEMGVMVTMAGRMETRLVVIITTMRKKPAPLEWNLLLGKR